jgi:signal transduction histidine kinase
MHRMLGVLRVQNGGPPEREPQPGVRDLDSLLAGTRQAGLDATLAIEGTPTELPPGVDLSAYRIVQEALTNVIRHAGAAHAAVTLRYLPEALEVTVSDDGAGPTAGASGGGHGLVGMRERVALFGGELKTGPRPDGRGYHVHALLPLD